jgi:hypothetical protein
VSHEDEAALVAAILRGDPAASRNRNFELLSSDVGRRARRRAAFLRSIARDLEHVRKEPGASVTIEHGTFARGRVRLLIHRASFLRRAYLTDDEVTLLARTFPLAARVFDVGASE